MIKKMPHGLGPVWLTGNAGSPLIVVKSHAN